MSVKVMGDVWSTNLAPNHKLVLLAYADAAEHDGTQAYPGWERLVEMTGYSRSQVERITKELIGLGVLERVAKGRKGRRAEFAIRVSQDATLDQPVSVAKPPDSVAQLRDTSRPTSRPEHSPNGEYAPLFEAFYQFWTGRRYVEAQELPKSMRGRLNAAVKEARLAGITGEQVARAGQRYRETWSRMERTPQALLANWARFGLDDSPIEECGECGNRGVIWFNAAGERCEYDDAIAESAAHCPACHPEAT